jgi:hypothetical protein
MKRNMAYEMVSLGGRRVYVALHTRDAPSSDEWDGWVALLDKNAKEDGFDLERTPNLVVTDGGAPDREQRTAVNVIVSQAKTLPSVALVTDSIVVRSMVRAFSIFNPRVAVFAPADFNRALTHIGLATSTRPELVARLTALADESLAGRRVDTLAALSLRG